MMKTVVLIFLLIYPLLVSSDETAKTTDSAVIFMYHRFGEEKYPSTNITKEQFAAQLEYLEKNHYNVWALSKIVRYFQKGKQVPVKTVAFTIDDAYISVYTVAYPMLKEKNYPFSVFVNTRPIDYKSKRYVSWDEMREMAKNGAEFANHTRTHEFLLPREDEGKDAWKKRVFDEVDGAQKRLHEELGNETNENPRMLAYPFGELDDELSRYLRSLGYLGVSQLSGVFSVESDFEAIPRFPMAESFANMKGFLLKLNTLPMPVESLNTSKHFVKQNPPKLRIKLKRELPRLACYLSSGEHIPLHWISKTEVEIQSEEPLKPPREHYTCTAPAEDDKWYWYSYLWIIKDKMREK